MRKYRVGVKERARRERQRRDRRPANSRIGLGNLGALAAFAAFFTAGRIFRHGTKATEHDEERYCSVSWTYLA